MITFLLIELQDHPMKIILFIKYLEHQPKNHCPWLFNVFRPHRRGNGMMDFFSVSLESAFLIS